MALNDYRMNTYPGIIDVPREETSSLLAKVLAITSFGFFITALGLFYMSGINLQMNMGHAAEVRFFQSLGLGFLFVPISTMSYVGVSQDQSNDVSGMTNLARNIGGSCGTGFFTTVLARHQQLHQHVLVGHTTKGNLFFNNQLAKLTDLHGSHQALAQIYQRVQQQASLLSYLDIIMYFGIASLAMAPIAFLMKKNVGGKIVMH